MNDPGDEWGVELCGGWGGVDRPGWVEVAAVRGHTPAASAGIRPGDRLVAVNQRLVVFLDPQEALKAMNVDPILLQLEFERLKQKYIKDIYKILQADTAV